VLAAALRARRALLWGLLCPAFVVPWTIVLYARWSGSSLRALHIRSIARTDGCRVKVTETPDPAIQRNPNSLTSRLLSYSPCLHMLLSSATIARLPRVVAPAGRVSLQCLPPAAVLANADSATSFSVVQACCTLLARSPSNYLVWASWA
jgi:hypothetical protein